MKHLGRKIRLERKALGMTLEKFAKLVGTSKATLQRIESGAKSPSVEQLFEISHICRKPISHFIHEDQVAFRKFEEKGQKKILTHDSKITIIAPYGLISSDLVVNHFAAKPGAHMDPHREEGHEWIYVLKGKCEVVYDGTTYNLKPGDVICYDASKLHSYKILTPFESIRISIRN